MGAYFAKCDAVFKPIYVDLCRFMLARPIEWYLKIPPAVNIANMVLENPPITGMVESLNLFQVLEWLNL